MTRSTQQISRPPQFRRAGTVRRASGVVAPLFVTSSATGTRTRYGTAGAVSLVSSSATGTRGRTGYAVPVASGGGGGGGGGTASLRWRFNDLVTAAAYVFEYNPNAGGSPTAKRNTTSLHTTAADGRALTFEGDPDIDTGELSGVLHTQAQYDALVVWFNKRRPIGMTDDLGRFSIINITKFTTKRKPQRHLPFRHEYTLTYLILQQVS